MVYEQGPGAPPPRVRCPEQENISSVISLQRGHKNDREWFICFIYGKPFFQPSNRAYDLFPRQSHTPYTDNVAIRDR